MAKLFSIKYPGLTGLLIGLLIGLGGISGLYSIEETRLEEITDRHERTTTSLQELTSKQTIKINSLKEENKHLKKRTVVTKITHPDGTIEFKEVTELDEDSATVHSVSISKISELSSKVAVLEVEKRVLTHRIEETKKATAATIGIGINSNTVPYIWTTVNVLGPLSIEGHIGSDLQIVTGIGWKF